MFLCRGVALGRTIGARAALRVCKQNFGYSNNTSNLLRALSSNGIKSFHFQAFGTDSTSSSDTPLTDHISQDLERATQESLIRRGIVKVEQEIIKKIVNGREVIIPKPLPTKFNKSTLDLINSEENTSIREPRLRRWKEKQKRMKLRKNPWKDYMKDGVRDDPNVEYERREKKNKPIPRTDWKNYSPIQSPLDFTPLEKEYTPDFDKKVATRKNLWYHRKAHKRANHLIHHLNKELSQERRQHFEVPDFKGGDALEIHFQGNMASGRDNIFRGVCLARRNAGISSSFKIIGVVDEVPVEYHFPLYSPLISKIRLVKKGFIKKGAKKVRRAKVYYIRDLPSSTYTVTKADIEAADAQDRRDAVKAKKAAKKLMKMQVNDTEESKNFNEEGDKKKKAEEEKPVDDEK